MDVPLQLPVLAIDAPSRSEPNVLENGSPPEITAWAVRRFACWRLLATTQFGMEGCALIDMLAHTGSQVEVVYLDTQFFFAETYALRDRLVERYPSITFRNEGSPLSVADQAATYGDELWRRDPDACCELRKVAPMRRVMERTDVWITGLRRGQSAARGELQAVQWDWRFDVLKINPLARWSRSDVWRYVQEREVPFNPLHEREYPSIGCVHCTKPVPGSSIGEYSREGRWAETEKTECGLHLGENI